MDFLSFLSKVIEAVAWPSAAVIIAFAFRRELKSLMPSLRKLKVGSLEAEFEREVKALELKVSNLITPDFLKELESRQHDLLSLADVDPRAAIAEAWNQVGTAVRKAAQHHIAFHIPDTMSALSSMDELVKNDIVKASDAALFHELRSLKNQATHAIYNFNPNYESAVEYIKMASLLEAHLTKLTQ